MRLNVVVVSLALGLLAASGCGPRTAQAPPPPATVAVSPIVEPSRAPPAVSPVAAGGYLEGRASIGPLQPVERIGVPSPTPPAAACTNRGLVISSAASGQLVQRLAFEPDCTYRVMLAPGDYRVELDARGIDRSNDLPRTVTIANGQTTRLDVTIDTGIR